MLFDRRFDYVISIGEDCPCAMYLKRHKLRDASYPFDWLRQATFEKRIELIVNDFCGFMKKENLRWYAKPVSGERDRENDYYEDTETNFQFMHDFKEGVPLDESYDAVNEKYQRRIARLYHNVAQAENTLFVWWTRDKDIPCEILMDSQKALSRKFSKNVCLLAIQNDSSREDVLLERPDASVIRAKAPVRDAENSIMGNKEVSDKIFSQIVLSQKQRSIVRIKRLLENLICIFIPYRPLRKKVRNKIREI